MIWCLGGIAPILFGVDGSIETALKALTKAQEDANQIARDRLSLDRQRFEREGRR